MKTILLSLGVFLSLTTFARSEDNSPFRINRIRFCDSWVYNQTGGHYSCLYYPDKTLSTPVVSDLTNVIVDLKAQISRLEERVSKLEASANK